MQGWGCNLWLLGQFLAKAICGVIYNLAGDGVCVCGYVTRYMPPITGGTVGGGWSSLPPINP